MIKKVPLNGIFLLNYGISPSINKILEEAAAIKLAE